MYGEWTLMPDQAGMKCVCTRPRVSVMQDGSKCTLKEENFATPPNEMQRPVAFLCVKAVTSGQVILDVRAPANSFLVRSTRPILTQTVDQANYDPCNLKIQLADGQCSVCDSFDIAANTTYYYRLASCDGTWLSNTVVADMGVLAYNAQLSVLNSCVDADGTQSIQFSFTPPPCEQGSVQNYALRLNGNTTLLITVSPYSGVTVALQPAGLNSGASYTATQSPFGGIIISVYNLSTVVVGSTGLNAYFNRIAPNGAVQGCTALVVIPPPVVPVAPTTCAILFGATAVGTFPLA